MNAAIIHIHYIQIRVLSLPNSMPVSLVSVHMCALTLYVNVCHESYSHNALLCMQIIYVYIITTSLLCKDLVQACIICAQCIGKCAALCAATAVTDLHCPSWPVPPMFFDLLLHLLPW